MNFTYGPRATNIRIPNDFEARMTQSLVNAYEFPEGSEVLVVSVSTRPIYYTPRTEEVSAHLEVNGRPRCVVYHRSL